MISGFGWAALALLFGYLALFFWGSALAAQAAGRSVWLFSRATGRDRLAAMGFRAAFALAFFGPLLWLAVPALHKVDPLWTEGRAIFLGLIGVFVAGLGAMVAFAAQMSMGSSWRVGVTAGETGDLVEAAANLFHLLREADALAGPDGRIAVAPVPERGLGRAINDRLRRAAAPRP